MITLKKYIKESFLFVFIFIVILSLLTTLVNSRLTPFGYHKERYPNIQKATLNADLIFLGTSQAFNAYNPEIFDSNLKIYSYNLATPAEFPLSTYYRFKDAIEKSTPKVAVVDIYFKFLSEDISLKYVPHWLNSMSESNKKKLMNEISFKDRLQLYLNLTHMDRKINELVKSFSNKRLAGYKGFLSSKNKISSAELETNNHFEGYSFKVNNNIKKNMDYLDKIIALAKRKKIKLIFITTPLPSKSFEYIKNYNEIHEYINNYLEKRDIPYYDFNILEKPIFIDEEDFMDSNHLNYFGSIKISEYISKEILEEEMFK